MGPVGVVVIGRKLELGMTRGLRAAHGGVGFQGPYTLLDDDRSGY